MDVKLSEDKLSLPTFSLGHGVATLLVIGLASIFVLYILLPLLGLLLSAVFYLIVFVGIVMLVWVLAPTIVISAIGGLLSAIDRIRD